MEDSDKPKETSNKPNNEVLVLKQLKSIKVALWTLVTVFVILPVVAGIGTGVVIGFIALTADSPHSNQDATGWEVEHGAGDESLPASWGEPTKDGEAVTGSDGPSTDGTDE